MQLSFLIAAVTRNVSASPSTRGLPVGRGRQATLLFSSTPRGGGGGGQRRLQPSSAISFALRTTTPSNTRLFSGGGGRPPSKQQTKQPHQDQQNPKQSQTQSTRRDPKATGRGRYGKLGKKDQKQENEQNRGRTVIEEQNNIQPPPLTWNNGPRPTYFTCRHGYESTLMNELMANVVLANKHQSMHDKPVSTPALGLVRMEDLDGSGGDLESLRSGLLKSISNPNHLDPVYALQTLPNCVVVSANSIKGLSQEIYEALLEGNSKDQGNDVRSSILKEHLRRAPRSSLAIHGLVTGMFKGQRKPLLERRVQTIVQELNQLLRKGYPAARKGQQTPKQEDEGGDAATILEPSSSSSSIPREHSRDVQRSDRWLLQVLLMTPDVAMASLVKCGVVHPAITTASTGTDTNTVPDVTSYWPNWHFPAGLAKVDITDEEMPSSAYRKLMEALECMRIRPPPSAGTNEPAAKKNLVSNHPVYDLGACPGGWTWILRHYLDCSVIAIDKSPLDARLMKDSQIEFIQGDAFTFDPTSTSNIASSTLFKPWQQQQLLQQERQQEVWMVSDVIAYPDRILELLSRWCGGKWADYMIVTMKFHGSEPDLEALHKAIGLAQSQGYRCRAKHFFNNKNEVTLMLMRNRYHEQQQQQQGDGGVGGNTTPTVPAFYCSPRKLEEGRLGTPMYPSIPTAS